VTRVVALGTALLCGCAETRPCDLPSEDPQFIQLSSNGKAVMALRSDGRAVCWGDDRSGACGHRGYGEFDLPYFSRAVSCARSVEIDSVGSAITNSNHLIVWGAEDTVEFGDGPAVNISHGTAKPVPVPPVTKATLRGVALALADDGAVWSWGERALRANETESISRPTQLKLPFEARATDVASFTTECVLDGEGNAYCRGLNERGEVGDGTFEPRYEFTRVLLPEPAVSLVSAFTDNCALLKSRRVACWGANSYAQFKPQYFPVPQVIPGVEGVDVVRMPSFGPGACAFVSRGPMACWGAAMNNVVENWDGSPRIFPVFDDIVDVAFGDDGRGCVIRASDNWVYCSGFLRGNQNERDPEYKMMPIPEPREL
jgi:hypothetical protein